MIDLLGTFLRWCGQKPFHACPTCAKGQKASQDYSNAHTFA